MKTLLSLLLTAATLLGGTTFGDGVHTNECPPTPGYIDADDDGEWDQSETIYDAITEEGVKKVMVGYWIGWLEEYHVVYFTWDEDDECYYQDGEAVGSRHWLAFDHGDAGLPPRFSAFGQAGPRGHSLV